MLKRESELPISHSQNYLFWLNLIVRATYFGFLHTKISTGKADNILIHGSIDFILA